MADHHDDLDRGRLAAGNDTPMFPAAPQDVLPGSGHLDGESLVHELQAGPKRVTLTLHDGVVLQGYATFWQGFYGTYVRLHTEAGEWLITPTDIASYEDLS